MRGRGRLAAAAALLGAAICWGGRWRPALAEPEESACAAELRRGNAALERATAGWARAARQGRALPLRRLAAEAEQRVLELVDEECRAERAALAGALRREAWQAFQEQRKVAEIRARERLQARLLTRMRRRGAPLRVREKLEELRAAVGLYRREVAAALPEGQDEPSEEEAERRLGELQFGVERSPEGQQLARRWALDRSRRLAGERAKGFSVSLDPGLRVMVRPEGFGNLQVFSEGPVGPPSQPATVNIGVMNDGSIADVYREHPVPPKIAVQPAVKVNLNVR